MATVITNVTFESLKEDIIKIFEILHQKLDERKQFLMGQLLDIKEEMERSNDLDIGIRKLKEAKELILIKLQDNIFGREREVIDKTLDDQIKEAEARKLIEKSCRIKLCCYTLKLEKAILQISLVEDIPAYANKISPIIKCGSKGAGQGEFNAPRGICIENDTNNLYVADLGNKRIQVLNKLGKYVNVLGTHNLIEPWGVAVNEQFVFVTDQVKHSVVQFSRDGSFIRTVGSYGSGSPLAFNRPRGIAVYNDKIYVCDSGNHRLQVVDRSLKYIDAFRANELAGPSDIFITSCIIHVLPEKGNIVHLFSHTGYNPLRVVKLIGQEYNMTVHFYFAMDQLGNYLISAQDEHHIRIFDFTGALRHIIGDGYMSYPRGISVNCNNNINCVTGTAGNNKFQMY